MPSSSSRSRAASVVLGLAASLLAPAAALGVTTASYSSSSGLLVTGNAAADAVRVEVRLDRFNVTRFTPSSSPILIAGSGCQSEGASLLCLFAGADSRVVKANLGDGVDTFAIIALGVPGVDTFIDGGGGNDQLFGHTGADFIDGGPGDDLLAGGFGVANDVIEGGDGNEVFIGDSGGTDTFRGEGGNDVFRARSESTSPSADLFDGGPGVDVADYSLRGNPVSLKVSLQSTPTPDDGAPGEGDDLDGVETLIGGGGADMLEVFGTTFGTVRTVFTLRANAGADILRAVDQVRTAMDGGAGADRISGGASEDVIFSRDGVRDAITCGGALDTVTSDLRDQPLPVDCEIIDQGDRREGPNVSLLTRIARVDEDGVVRVRLACPRSVRVGCRGTLVARLDRRGARFGAKERYSLNRGGSTVVEVALPPGQIGAARRPGARVRVRSVEAGVHGPKTTQRSLAARPR
jgi:hypothetical protein